MQAEFCVIYIHLGLCCFAYSWSWLESTILLCIKKKGIPHTKRAPPQPVPGSTWRGKSDSKVAKGHRARDLFNSCLKGICLFEFSYTKLNAIRDERFASLFYSYNLKTMSSQSYCLTFSYINHASYTLESNVIICFIGDEKFCSSYGLIWQHTLAA